MLALAAALLPGTQAQETIKIDLITAIRGQFATNGKQLVNGVNTFMKQHGDTVAGRKVDILLRDSIGAAPSSYSIRQSCSRPPKFLRFPHTGADLPDAGR